MYGTNHAFCCTGTFSKLVHCCSLSTLFFHTFFFLVNFLSYPVQTPPTYTMNLNQSFLGKVCEPLFLTYISFLRSHLWYNYILFLYVLSSLDFLRTFCFILLWTFNISAIKKGWGRSTWTNKGWFPGHAILMKKAKRRTKPYVR